MPWVKTGPVYQLKITLRDFRPSIWRRVLVPGHYTLADLHYVVQFAMGWMDSHLHHFEVGETHYSLPTPGTDWEDGGEVDSRPVRLDVIAPSVKTKFLYLYDFGDSWEHDVLVEKISPPDSKMKYPVCLAGKGACPLEDVGGVWGYAEFLQAIKDPEHSEHDEYLEWVGGEFDPKAFDLVAVNKALKRLK
ncbi:MAG: plasmid pRiA4b ORF-3 family protein [Chloroflexi bacterium]|nr:plasmid pRiA4b ORF-3 family protein [Chloroflexota bacterium]